MAKRIRLSKEEKLSILLDVEDSNEGLFENSFIPLLAKYEYKISEKESHLKVLSELMRKTTKKMRSRKSKSIFSRQKMSTLSRSL